MLKSTKKTLFLIAGWTSLVLGIVGAFLPVLPTTPFAILAAWCFSKSSDRLHQWLLNNKIFGPMIRDWEEKGVIALKSKWLATSMIVLLFSYTLIFVNVHLAIKIIVSITGISVLAFIWSRPSRVIEEKSTFDNVDSKSTP